MWTTSSAFGCARPASARPLRVAGAPRNRRHSARVASLRTTARAHAGSRRARDPARGRWLYEPKWDGFRAIVFRDGDRVHIASRNALALERYFPELIEPLQAALPDRCDRRRRDRHRHRPRPRLRRPPAAHPSRRVPRAHARRADPRLGRPLRPPRARRRRPPRAPARPSAGAACSSAIKSSPIRRRDAADHATPTRRPLVHALRRSRSRRGRCEGSRRGLPSPASAAGPRSSTSAPSTASSAGIGSPRTARASDHCSSASTTTTAPSTTSATRRRSMPRSGVPSSSSCSRWSAARASVTDGHRADRAAGQSAADSAYTSVSPELVCEVSFDHLQSGRFRHASRFLRWRPDKAPKSCDFDQLSPPKHSRSRHPRDEATEVRRPRRGLAAGTGGAPAWPLPRARKQLAHGERPTELGRPSPLAYSLGSSDPRSQRMGVQCRAMPELTTAPICASMRCSTCSTRSLRVRTTRCCSWSSIRRMSSGSSSSCTSSTFAVAELEAGRPQAATCAAAPHYPYRRVAHRAVARARDAHAGGLPRVSRPTEAGIRTAVRAVPCNRGPRRLERRDAGGYRRPSPSTTSRSCAVAPTVRTLYQALCACCARTVSTLRTARAPSFASGASTPWPRCTATMRARSVRSCITCASCSSITMRRSRAGAFITRRWLRARSGRDRAPAAAWCCLPRDDTIATAILPRALGRAQPSVTIDFLTTSTVTCAPRWMRGTPSRDSGNGFSTTGRRSISTATPWGVFPKRR